MTSYLTSRRAAIAAAGGLLVALSFSGVAQAITDTVFRYSAPKTGFYTIGHMAMAPNGTDSADDYNIDGAGGGGLSTGAIHCFNTGVNLPQGATISAVTIYYRSGANGNVYAALFRHKLADGTRDSIFEKTFADDSNTRKAGVAPVTAAFAAVNNAQYSYGFGTCMDSTETFYAARIAYKYRNAGD